MFIQDQYIEFLKEQALNLNGFDDFYRSIERENELNFYASCLIRCLNILGSQLLPEIMPYPGLRRGNEHGLSGPQVWLHAINCPDGDSELAKRINHIVNQIDSLKFFLNENKYHPVFAAWALKNHGIGNKENTDIIFTQSDVSAVCILLNCAGIDIKANWEIIKSDEVLRKFVLVLDKYGINLSSNWDNLKHNKGLQQAILALKSCNLDLKKYWFVLNSSNWLVDSIANPYAQLILDEDAILIFNKSSLELLGLLFTDLCLMSYKAHSKNELDHFHYWETYSYQQLQEFTKMLIIMNSPETNEEDKLAAIGRYEAGAKKKLSGWGRFSKLMAIVICTGIGFTLGVTLGAIGGGALASVVNPGIGSIIGAIIGAIAAGSKGAIVGGTVGGVLAGGLSTFGFFSSSQKEKMSRHLARQGRESIPQLTV